MLYLGAKKSLLSSGKTLAQQIAALFAQGEQGAWYEPSLTNGTLFQDSAGTLPVTAVGQPVGLMLDKSGRGNAAMQSTAINRPVLSARVNLLTKTEQFDDAAWGKNAVVAVTANQGVAPNRQAEADRVVRLGGVSPNWADLTGVIISGGSNAGKTYTGSMWLWTESGTVNASLAISDLAYSTMSASIVITTTPTRFAFTTAGPSGAWNVAGTQAGLGLNLAVGGSVLVWGAQLETGSTATRYQRVNTETDYDTVDFPFFGDHNGTNSRTSSATEGGGNAGFFLCQAVKPKGRAGAARTIWSDAGVNTGYRVRVNASNQLELSAGNGTAYTSIASVATLPVGETHLITAWDDGVNLNVQIDAGAVASVARPVVSAGTAGFTVGADNGTAANFFPGNLYAEVYRQVAPNTAQIASAQRYCKSKAGL